MGSVRRHLLGQEPEVAERYLAGASMRELGTHFGVSDSTIARALDAAGVKSRPRHRRSRVIGHEQPIADAYRAGATIDELAEQWGCSKTPIRDALARAGVTHRPPGRRSRIVGLESRIAAQYVAGASYREIEGEYGITRHTVRTVLTEQGITTRRGRRRAALLEARAS